MDQVSFGAADRIIPTEPKITFILGADYVKYFRTDFGEYMFNAILSQFFAVLIIPLIFLLIFKKDFRSTLRLKKNIDFFQILMLVLASLGVFFGAQIINQFFVNGLSSFSIISNTDRLFLVYIESITEEVFVL